MTDAPIIARGLALLHEAFPTRTITADTGAAWELLMRDVGNRAFLEACLTLAKERGRTFFPTPAEVLALADPAQVYDPEAVVREIARLGGYNPNVGWIYPRVDEVRQRLGAAIADAYAEAGASQMFSEQSVGRDIALRTFRDALQREAVLPRPDRTLPAGPSTSAPLRLTP